MQMWILFLTMLKTVSKGSFKLRTVMTVVKSEGYEVSSVLFILNQWPVWQKAKKTTYLGNNLAKIWQDNDLSWWSTTAVIAVRLFF